MKRIMPLAVALGALLGCTSAQANTYTPSPSAVDSTSANGQCSLRDAIEAANGTPLDACPSTPGAAATILLAPGAYHLVGGHLAELKITQSMTIAGGGGGSTTISKDDHLDRVFEVAGTSPVVTISGVTITGGHADNGSDNSGSPFVGYVGNPGGGILSAGTLTLDGVTVTGNSAGNGGAGGINGTSGLDGGVGGAGGGIAYTGSLTLRNSTVSNNAA